jgi:hypothetical protein
VYVIGIADSGDTVYENVLNAMADAGGRPNMSGPQRYYGVRQPADLQSAFRTISQAIAQCAFVMASHPANPDAITVLLNGAPVARDPSHTNGWDLTDPAMNEVTFFGSACNAVVTNPNATVAALVGCNDS